MKKNASVFLLILSFFFLALTGHAMAALVEQKFFAPTAERASHYFELSERDLIFDPNYYRGSHNANELRFIYPAQFKCEMLVRGFTSRSSLLELEKANWNYILSATQLLPKLQIGLSPLGVTSAVSGIFGSFVPANWFKLGESWKESTAMQFSLLSILSAQYFNAEIFYLNLQKQQRDLSILRSYLARVQGLITYLVQDKVRADDNYLNDNVAQTMEEYLANQHDNLANQEKLYQQSLIEMSYLMGRSADGALFPSMINIRDLTEQEWQEDLVQIESIVQRLPQNEAEIKKLLQKVFIRSYELKSLQALKQAGWWGFFDKGLDFISADQEIKLAISASTLPRLVLAKKEIELLRVKEEEIRAQLEKELRQVLWEMEAATMALATAGQGLEKNTMHFRSLFAAYLPSTFSSDSNRKKTLDGIIYTTDLRIQLHLKMNAALANFRRAHWRFLQITHDENEINKMLKLLPDKYRSALAF